MLAPLGPDGGLDGPPGVGGDRGLESPLASPVGGGFGAAAEVETEFEDEGEEEKVPAMQVAHEVEEEELQSTTAEDEPLYEPRLPPTRPRSSSSRPVSRSSSRPSSGRSSSQQPAAPSGVSGDYAVPNANREVWKSFGCNTEAGRALRRLYKSGSASDASSMVAYPRMPSPSAKWEPKPKARGPCPQRAAVRIPRAQRQAMDPDDPRNWRAPLPGRKPANEILAEMEANRPQVPVLPRGRDQVAEKNNLQDRFQFCGGRAMPKGAMGHVEKSALPEPEGPTTRARLEDRRRKDENGMNAEHREIFEELMLAIKRKQERLKEIQAEEVAEARPSKVTTTRNKEALELRNDIDRCLKDIDKLMDLTAADGQ